MAKSKSILISGNPFVQLREKGEDKFSLRLVYNLGDVYEMDVEGNKKRRQQWRNKIAVEGHFFATCRLFFVEAE